LQLRDTGQKTVRVVQDMEFEINFDKEVKKMLQNKRQQ